MSVKPAEVRSGERLPRHSPEGATAGLPAIAPTRFAFGATAGERAACSCERERAVMLGICFPPLAYARGYVSVAQSEKISLTTR
jgi:hypothetical protein